MAIPSILLNFLFPPPPSLFITTMSIIGISSLTNAGFMEIKGKHMQYSKFLNVGAAKKQNEKKLSSRNGMLWFYTPAFLVGLASLLVFHDQDQRFVLLACALTIHFLKRVLEVPKPTKESKVRGRKRHCDGRRQQWMDDDIRKTMEQEFYDALYEQEKEHTNLDEDEEQSRLDEEAFQQFLEEERMYKRIEEEWERKNWIEDAEYEAAYYGVSVEELHPRYPYVLDKIHALKGTNSSSFRRL